MTDTDDRLTTGPQVAAAVAAEIRQKGHFQGRGNEVEFKSCLLANDAYARVTSLAWNAYLDAVSAEIGAEVANGGFALWNDTHTTDEVLAVLDKIAEQEHSNA